MGVYNNVEFKCQCPNCGERLDGFQTYDGEPMFLTVTAASVANFHGGCDNCGAWLEFARDDNGAFIVTAVTAK
ncbi:Uncharacterised protein [Candidatus Venteria ishoeyi]|uniref:Uncharacterized protein n=1 Tax=Candidatus Venteria ishoeyi TaxID=1899563 RepID=A0A1H6FBS6_9GAMM|nr:Uncharacterised protein [Candidatus Venteria ishoeyi]